MTKFEILFTPVGAEEFDYWKNNDSKIYEKLVRMLHYIENTYPPKLFHPKALTGNFKGCIRLKITAEHRLVYRIKNQHIEIMKCKGHYDDR